MHNRICQSAKKKVPYNKYSNLVLKKIIRPNCVLKFMLNFVKF